MKVLVFLMDLVDLLATAIDWWKLGKAREEGRQEIIEQQAKAYEAAKVQAQTIRDRVAHLSERDLDDGLRQFTRPQ